MLLRKRVPILNVIGIKITKINILYIAVSPKH